ncbi:MAG: hypothetical protein KA085_13300 [Phenylobacterium sp.]|mgnify:CR=1 FL=1|uniref:hypothetical protein n=1 Tax=Phenylobacterium sp. TaxID=1871053 RepID=UPI001B5CDDDC|nr:hypothetical protein [Phenylobacterium sp.]MBP7817100.1 hypothetical protein [Phenylobacterium sp.]
MKSGLLTLFAIASVASSASADVRTIDVPIEVSAPRGFAMRTVSATRTPNGTRFHGAVCRRSRSLAPTRLRVERIGANGQILASTSQSLSGLSVNQRHCQTFDLVTAWEVTPSDRFRVCAKRDATHCVAP